MPETFKNIKYILLGSLTAALLFFLLDILFIQLGAWTIAGKGLSGLFFYDLPIEVFILNFLLVILGLLLYEFLNDRFPKNDLDKYSLSFSNLMLGLCIALGFFGYAKWYTIILFSLLLILLLYIEYLSKIRFMYRFYRTYFVFLFYFWLVNWILIEKGFVQFNLSERLKIEIGILPVENYFYGMAMLLVAVFILEKLKLKTVS